MFVRALVPAAALLAGVCASTALAGDGEGEGGRGELRSGPVLDGDWFGDDVESVGAPSDAGPYDFALTHAAFFRITDAFVTGDQFWATDGARGLLGTTSMLGSHPSTLFGVDPIGEAAWRSGSYQTLQVLLTPGNYSITVTGNGAGGLPAGFYVQLESVPAPAAAGLLGLAGLAAARRRR
jgi:MYXO-CTERM domain-containing protein